MVSGDFACCQGAVGAEYLRDLIIVYDMLESGTVWRIVVLGELYH